MHQNKLQEYHIRVDQVSMYRKDQNQHLKFIIKNYQLVMNHLRSKIIK